MDDTEMDYEEASTSAHTTRRQQTSEYRRRLEVPRRAPANVRADQTPTTMPRNEDRHRSLGISPAAEWDSRGFQEYAPRDEVPNAVDQEITGTDDMEVGVEAGADLGVDHIEGVEADVEPEASEVDEAENAEEEEEQPFDATALGLKEISNLASFTVSSYKPGCGVKELRDDDVNQYWQSDGAQPHRLNIHFIKRVEIRALRLYLDYELDESYTPTKIQITAGTGPNLTIPYTIMELSQPKGWIDVPIAGAGGGHDGNSLCCFFVRVIILENHQNGKDTHIRGVKVYALDEEAGAADKNPIEDAVGDIEESDHRLKRRTVGNYDDDPLSHPDAESQERPPKKKYVPGDGGLTIPSFMREPEIR